MAREFDWSKYSVNYLPVDYNVGRNWRTDVGEAVTDKLDGLPEPIIWIAEIIAEREIARLSGPGVYFASLLTRNRLYGKGWRGVQVVRGTGEDGNRVAYFRLNLKDEVPLNSD